MTGTHKVDKLGGHCPGFPRVLMVILFVPSDRWLRANRQKVWDSNPTCRGPRDLGGKPVESMTFEDLCDGQWASMVKLTPRVPIRWRSRRNAIGLIVHPSAVGFLKKKSTYKSEQIRCLSAFPQSCTDLERLDAVKIA